MVRWRNKILTFMAICLLLTLFPPCVGGKSDREDKFIGFHLLLGTPKYRSSRQQVSKSTTTVNGKEHVKERRWYPKHEYAHSQIDMTRYTLLTILAAIGVISFGLLESKSIPAENTKDDTEKGEE